MSLDISEETRDTTRTGQVMPDRIADDAHALRIAKQLAEAFAPDAALRDRERRLPWAELDAFVASGLWGITVPRDFGGAGVSSGTLAEVTATISAADGSLGQIPQNHYYALEVLRVGGSSEQQRFFYDRVLAGERFGNALAETGHKDFKRRTRLARTAAGWHIDGRKFYCTGALYAHWIPTLVITEEKGRDITWLAFVPRDADGVEVIDDWDGFGQRVTGSGSVQFNHVRVEPEWVVPFQASFERPTTIGPLAQIIHAAIDLGQARGAFQAALQFVREHSRPWIDAKIAHAADDPLTIAQFGDLAVRLRAAQALLRRAARFVDAAQAGPTERSVAQASVAVAEARALTTTVSLDAGSRLFELAGTSATLDGLGLDRFWRNARTHTLHDPVRWKYHAVGNYYLNDTLPPRHGAL
ncbi:SfnB family sulfur acquisition oxidoreductase [Paraburkholderia caribensis]|uniref:SfnB family sulfur acquisition oxidoreductase n=1 Tax=Paraburkholderia caribensis TaxID=75105 RepID=A0A9Q6WR56_9BURK|nr:SfnB family sulfur acquisition oxidoreductase [Paraburkholderia caribensis]MCO4879465.1 SfnB family sulfur acquisition oxidoreductase [Paraburkholderia caribensis]PTB25370.1 SfnB family sulfur acquisition oxidoreductase [Paraburkholderia caribensis]QLB67980.1 SfnB family sulfur acquisition oxidoreductase [Paraburkholderia caribensis]